MLAPSLSLPKRDILLLPLAIAPGSRDPPLAPPPSWWINAGGRLASAFSLSPVRGRAPRRKKQTPTCRAARSPAGPARSPSSAADNRPWPSRNEGRQTNPSQWPHTTTRPAAASTARPSQRHGPLHRLDAAGRTVALWLKRDRQILQSQLHGRNPSCRRRPAAAATPSCRRTNSS